MMNDNDAPRYIVPQKMPTPISNIIVAIKVANGILVPQSEQHLPKLQLFFWEENIEEEEY
jgi:hypothetical protein